MVMDKLSQRWLQIVLFVMLVVTAISVFSVITLYQQGIRQQNEITSLKNEVSSDNFTIDNLQAQLTKLNGSFSNIYKSYLELLDQNSNLTGQIDSLWSLLSLDNKTVLATNLSLTVPPMSNGLISQFPAPYAGYVIVIGKHTTPTDFVFRTGFHPKNMSTEVSDAFYPFGLTSYVVIPILPDEQQYLYFVNQSTNTTAEVVLSATYYD